MSFRERTRRIHFIGIGGIGMSGIAEILLRLGHKVSGSDLSDGEAVKRLLSLGADIQKGHKPDLLEQYPPDAVVYSTAVKADNPEMVYAEKNGIPIIRRAEMLGELMRSKHGIALAGSHGKTTTTGLTALVLRAGGLDPTVVIGGRFDALGSNAALGEGRWMVAEADESDGSFLRLTPEIAVVTNIDREHLDHYGTFETELRTFEEFLDRLPFYGRAILCSDCPNLRSLRPRLRKPRFWYGFEVEHSPDFLVVPVSEGETPVFDIFDLRAGKKNLARVQLSVPGRHNMLNATGAVLVGLELGIPVVMIVSALKEFRGVQRRFERKGVWKGHPIIEDYAHHPTEIKATLAAAATVFAGKAPVVVFQPHRFTRTRDLWADFAVCFAGAGRVLALPIYAASEPRDAWTETYDREKFVENIAGIPSHFCENVAGAFEKLEEAKKAGHIPEGAPILVLGAGDVNKVIPLLLEKA